MMPSTRYDADAGSAGAPIEGARIHTGGLDATGMRFGVVVSRFNSIISTQLLDGAVEALRHHGVGAGDIEVVWVPGAFEIPIAARELAQLGGVDAVVCLGAVIRGETDHYNYVCAETARGVMSVQLDTGVPCSFGVLTCETMEQALERTGGGKRDQGRHAAEVVLRMAAVRAELGG